MSYQSAVNIKANDSDNQANSFFFETREELLKPVTEAFAGWNEAVAFLVDGFARHTLSDELWHKRVARALREMRDPLRSDFVLRANNPNLFSKQIKGHVRAFGAIFFEQNLEFMPRVFDYPKFPYFQVEPATLKSLAEAGLILFANPRATDKDEPDIPGTEINMKNYLQGPMISIELELSALPDGKEGAVLMNFSCKGRSGAKAKIFVDGRQYVSAFDVQTTTEDSIPNFWAFLPWREGKVIVDLKHVNSGYFWFEHVDIHHVEWSTSRD